MGRTGAASAGAQPRGLQPALSGGLVAVGSLGRRLLGPRSVEDDSLFGVCAPRMASGKPAKNHRIPDRRASTPAVHESRRSAAHGRNQLRQHVARDRDRHAHSRISSELRLRTMPQTTRSHQPVQRLWSHNMLRASTSVRRLPTARLRQLQGAPPLHENHRTHRRTSGFTADSTNTRRESRMSEVQSASGRVFAARSNPRTDTPSSSLSAKMYGFERPLCCDSGVMHCPALIIPSLLCS